MTISNVTPHAGNPTGQDHNLAEQLALEALGGALAGAAAGALAGPPGMAIGAILGGAVGAVAGEVLHLDHVAAEAREEALDRELCADGVNLAAEFPNQAPSRGIFHTASLGVSTGSGPGPAEGPMQNIEDD
jgi:phage tail tape-measure protein